MRALAAIIGLTGLALTTACLVIAAFSFGPLFGFGVTGILMFSYAVILEKTE